MNNGYPAVAIYNNTVVILLPDDESVKISSTVPKSTSKLVRKVTELNDIKADQIHFFAYATLLDNHNTADRNSNGNDDMIAAYANKNHLYQQLPVKLSEYLSDKLSVLQHLPEQLPDKLSVLQYLPDYLPDQLSDCVRIKMPDQL